MKQTISLMAALALFLAAGCGGDTQDRAEEIGTSEWDTTSTGVGADEDIGAIEQDEYATSVQQNKTTAQSGAGGQGAVATQTQSSQQSSLSAQSRMQGQGSERQVERILTDLGLSQEEISELSQANFEQEQVQEKLKEQFSERAAISEEEANRQAEQFAQQIAMLKGREQEAWGAGKQAGQQGQQASSKDSATVLVHEEELKVGKREVPAGGVLIEKDVVTEQVQKPVELERERINIERLSAEEAQKLGADEAQRLAEDRVYIPLKKEEAVVEKETEVVGGVRVEKQSDVQQQTVQGEVKREELDIQRQQQAQGGQRAQQFEQGQAQQQPETELSKRVRVQLIRTEQNPQGILNEQQAKQIKLQDKDGVLIIMGTVSDERTKQQIETRVKQTSGVRSVENKLQVQGQGGQQGVQQGGAQGQNSQGQTGQGQYSAPGRTDR